MGRLIVEQIISADGYAAELDGGIGFFSDARGINDADQDQLRRLEGVGAIVLGRTTYRMFADYWPEADPVQEPVAVPLNTIPKYVVSNTLDETPWGKRGDAVTVLRGDGTTSVRALRSRVDGDLIIWGSLTCPMRCYAQAKSIFCASASCLCLSAPDAPSLPPSSAGARWSCCPFVDIRRAWWCWSTTVRRPGQDRAIAHLTLDSSRNHPEPSNDPNYHSL